MEKRHFWSSAPGIITGIAGLLSATAAVVGLLVTFGVIGGKDSSSKATTAGTSTPAPDRSDGTTSTTAQARVSFTVSPKELTLTLLAPEGKVTVTNTGDSPVIVQTVVGGPAKAQFAVKNGSCSSEIAPEDYCELTVKFTPGSGPSEAALTISAKGASAQTLNLQGKPL
jgi:hypothetical protein